MREKIKELLNEIKFSQERADELKQKFGWRFVQSSNPKPNKTYQKLHVYTFRTPKYKYLVHIEEYEYDYYLISFFNILPRNISARVCFFFGQDNL